ELRDPSYHRLIADELAVEAGGTRVAYRGGARYVRQITPEVLVRQKPTPIRRNGVYVILGGAGGLGYAISDHLSRIYDARLVWIGRRPVDDDTIQEKIRKLATKAHGPLYIQADATDVQSLRDALDQIKQHHPRIHGVI